MNPHELGYQILNIFGTQPSNYDDFCNREFICHVLHGNYGKPSSICFEFNGSGPWCRVYADLYYSPISRFVMVNGKSLGNKFALPTVKKRQVLSLIDQFLVLNPEILIDQSKKIQSPSPDII